MYFLNLLKDSPSTHLVRSGNNKKIVRSGNNKGGETISNTQQMEIKTDNLIAQKENEKHPQN